MDAGPLALWDLQTVSQCNIVMSMSQIRQALLAFFVMGLPLVGAIVFVPAILIIHCNSVRSCVLAVGDGGGKCQQ